MTALTPSQSRLSREGSALAPRPNSYTPGTKSTPTSALEQSPSPTNVLSPQSASSAPGPSRTIRPSSWMKPLRLVCYNLQIIELNVNLSVLLYLIHDFRSHKFLIRRLDPNLHHRALD